MYAQCPYISGAYGDPPAELTSLFENDKYFLDVENMGAMAQDVRPRRQQCEEPTRLADARCGE